MKVKAPFMRCVACSRLAGLIFSAMAVVAALALVAPANAAVIDFESIATGACRAAPSIATDGFTFSTAAQNLFSCDGTRFDLPSNGTITVGSENPTVTTMALTGGGTFSVQSIDLGELFVDNTAPHLVELTGHRLDGGTVNTTFALDNINDGAGGVADFQTFLVPSSFVNLRSLVLTGTGQNDPRFMFDNVGVDAVDATPVPEPTSLLLIGSGLGAITARKLGRSGATRSTAL